MGARPALQTARPAVRTAAPKPAAPSAATGTVRHIPRVEAANPLPVYLRTAKASKIAAPASPPSSARHSSSGKPLDSALRTSLESRFQRDLSGVRIHSNAGDKLASTIPGARAVTIGSDIYFAAGAWSPNTAEGRELLAHEVTHVLQQRNAVSAALGRAGSHGDRFEQEARRNARGASGGGPLLVREHTAHAGPQPDEEDHGFFYNRLVGFFPEIKPILDRGVGNWLQDQVTGAVEAIVNQLMAPIRLVTGVVESLSTHFGQLVEWIKKAASSVARGDCSVLHEAVDYIEQAVSGVVSPILDKIKEIGKKIGDFFSGLWDRFGAPIWNEMKRIGGLAWEKIQQFGHWIWDKTAPLRDLVGRAWTWFKNLLGIGEGPEGQDGLLQWVERKAEAAWDVLKDKLEPVKKPLMVIGGIIIMLSPAGPIIAVGLAVGGVIEGVRAIKRYFGTRDGVVTGRQALRQVVVPKMIEVIRGFAQLLGDKARGLLATLRRAHDSVISLVQAAQQSIFSFLAALLQFVADRIDDLVKWGDEKVAAFLSWVESTTGGLTAFLDRILNVLDEIGAVVRDIMKLPALLMGKIWNAIPACIRDPFVDFFGVQILGRIAIFQALAGTPEAWAKTKNEVGLIIKEFFIDFNLSGAMQRAFRLLLTALDVPMELLSVVLSKLVIAWDTIKEKPVEFLKNLFRTMILAFKGFFKNILKHLANGITGWLTGQFKGTNVVLPTNWLDLGQIFGFVASVLGISLDHIFERMALKMDPDHVAKIRKAVNFATGAWEWIKLVLTGQWAALWAKIKEKISNLWNMLLDAVVGYIVDNVVAAVMEQLVTTADPTGVSETIMFIIDTYRTIKTAVQYMRQILTMMNTMLDSIIGIANGDLQPSADRVESAFDKAMPVVIGFLANLAGLGNLSEEIRETLTSIRAKVDEGIDWLIDKAKGVVEAVADGVSSVIGKITDWWRQRRKTKVGTEDHTLLFHGDEQNADLYIESTPMPLVAFLDHLEKQPGADLAKIGEIRTLATALKAKKDEGGMGVGRGEEIAALMTGIADKLKQSLHVEFPPTVIVTQEVQPVPGGAIAGKKVKAAPLTLRQPTNGWTGSQPADTSRFWQSVNQHTNTYIRGHLLNHNLFGPGRDENMTPIHGDKLNKPMSSQVEETVKAKVLDENKVISYEVEAVYGAWSPAYTGIPEENNLATGMRFAAREMLQKEGSTGANPGDWEETGPKLGIPSYLPNFRAPDGPAGESAKRVLKVVNLNLRSGDVPSAQDLVEAFQQVPYIGPTKALDLATNPTRFGTDWDRLRASLALPAEAVAGMRVNPIVRLVPGINPATDLVWG